MASFVVCPKKISIFISLILSLGTSVLRLFSAQIYIMFALL